VNEPPLKESLSCHTGITPNIFPGIVAAKCGAKKNATHEVDNRLTGIAMKAGISTGSFIREFKKYTGMTPHQYHGKYAACVELPAIIACRFYYISCPQHGIFFYRHMLT